MTDGIAGFVRGAPGPDRPGAPLVLPGRFRGVVLDLDGLLLDSEPAWGEAEAALLARHGQALSVADVNATHGRAPDETVALYARRLGLAAATVRAELIGLMRERYRAGLPLRPGAREVVVGLAGRIGLAVASNTDRDLVLAGLTAAGLLDALDLVVTTGPGVRPKPSPDLYLAACRGLGVAPRDAVAFEDSPVGVRAAKAGGLACVGVPERDGVDLAAAGADVVLGSLEEVVLATA